MVCRACLTYPAGAGFRVRVCVCVCVCLSVQEWQAAIARQAHLATKQGRKFSVGPRCTYARSAAVLTGKRRPAQIEKNKAIESARRLIERSEVEDESEEMEATLRAAIAAKKGAATAVNT